VVVEVLIVEVMELVAEAVAARQTVSRVLILLVQEQ
jgi:hypothetical protein